MRPLFLSGGFLSLGLGYIGIFLPILPTTPFMLLAAFCFSKSSPKLHSWLLSRPRIGPAIVDWEQSRVIRRKAKFLATALILLSISIPLSFDTISLTVKLILLGVISGVLLFIWSCPSASHELPHSRKASE